MATLSRAGTNVNNQWKIGMTGSSPDTLPAYTAFHINADADTTSNATRADAPGSPWRSPVVRSVSTIAVTTQSSVTAATSAQSADAVDANPSMVVSAVSAAIAASIGRGSRGEAAASGTSGCIR